MSLGLTQVKKTRKNASYSCGVCKSASVEFFRLLPESMKFSTIVSVLFHDTRPRHIHFHGLRRCDMQCTWRKLDRANSSLVVLFQTTIHNVNNFILNQTKNYKLGISIGDYRS